MWWLVSQILGYMAIAAALGLALGYLFWGWKRAGHAVPAELTAARRRIAALERDLATANEIAASQEIEIARLKVEDVTANEPQPPLPAPPASLLAERPDEADDLQRIRGIGPKMEEMLNARGIWLYRQLVEFSDDDIAWLGAAIETFPDRIARDRWVEQATDLMREKYGTE